MKTPSLIKDNKPGEEAEIHRRIADDAEVAEIPADHSLELDNFGVDRETHPVLGYFRRE